MSDDNPSAFKTCRKTPWDKVDITLLLFLLASIITLIVTVTCVWYPYLETSSFIYSQCRVLAIHAQGTTECVNPPANCIPDTISSPTYPTDWTDPFSATSSSSLTSTSLSGPATSNTSLMTSLSSSVTSTTAATTEATTEITADSAFPTSVYTDSLPESNSSSQSSGGRKRRQVTPPPRPPLSAASYGSDNYCPAFPCYQVSIFYSNYFVAGLNVSLRYNYYQLQTYPQCAYSSCDSDNEENVQAVNDWIATMKNYQASRQLFGCYANVNNGYQYQVIQYVTFTYSSGVNSIFWPIVFLIGFFFALLFHRCRNVTVGRSSSSRMNRPPPEYDSDCQVNYSNLRTPTVMTEPVYTTPPYVYGAEGGGGGGPCGEKSPEAMDSFYGRSDAEMSNPWPLATQPPPYLEFVGPGEPGYAAPGEVSAASININIAGVTDGELRY